MKIRKKLIGQMKIEGIEESRISRFSMSPRAIIVDLSLINLQRGSSVASRKSIKGRRCQSAIVDSSHVAIIIHLGSNYFANYLGRLARGGFFQATTTIIRVMLRGERGGRAGGGGGGRGKVRAGGRGGWRLLSGHINVNFHPGSRRTYLQSKLLATKAAASVVAGPAGEGGGWEKVKEEGHRYRGEKMLQYALLRYY